jgi:hypothetical protein
VLGYDPAAQVPPQVWRFGVDAPLRQSDIVSLHAPVTPETQGMLSRAVGGHEARRVARGTPRAALTDEDALYEALRAGRQRRGPRRARGRAGSPAIALPGLAERNRHASRRATVDVVRHHSGRSWTRSSAICAASVRRIANPAVYESR